VLHITQFQQKRLVVQSQNLGARRDFAVHRYRDAVIAGLACEDRAAVMLLELVEQAKK
jgi:hypothetical protein